MSRQAPRILLVDNHSAVRQGLALVLEGDSIGKCFEAAGCAEAREVVRTESPDVALVDLSMGDEDALALVAELHARRIPVLVCSSHEDPSHVKRAMAAGARGYITKCEAPQGVARAVRAVLEGWMMISPHAVENLDEEHEDSFLRRE